jgi:nucleotidyltransferase substrate binding protein (TIGR01987 family)
MLNTEHSFRNRIPTNMPLITNSLELSKEALARALSVTGDSKLWASLSVATQEAIRAGVIQSFEVAYEQSWKMMKRWLELNTSPVEIDGVSRRQLYRLACEAGLIADVDLWMLFHKARNETSHIYNAEKAKAVFEMAPPFLEACSKLLAALNSKND